MLVDKLWVLLLPRRHFFPGDGLQAAPNCSRRSCLVDGRRLILLTNKDESHNVRFREDPVPRNLNECL